MGLVLFSLVASKTLIRKLGFSCQMMKFVVRARQVLYLLVPGHVMF